MSVTSQIVASYRSPGQIADRLVSGPVREDRALIYLMLACLLMFIAQVPRLAREAVLGGDVPFDVSLGAALFGWLFLAPLFFYLLAGASHLFSLLLGGRGTWYGARVVLFWALLASTPMWMLAGLVTGYFGPGKISDIAGLVPAAAFLVIWVMGLYSIEKPGLPDKEVAED